MHAFIYSDCDMIKSENFTGLQYFKTFRNITIEFQLKDIYQYIVLYIYNRSILNLEGTFTLTF